MKDVAIITSIACTFIIRECRHRTCCGADRGDETGTASCGRAQTALGGAGSWLWFLGVPASACPHLEHLPADVQKENGQRHFENPEVGLTHGRPWRTPPCAVAAAAAVAAADDHERISKN